ncbi:MAG: hypothetical protein R3Y07_05910 [Eubacteriales bacterium]
MELNLNKNQLRRLVDLVYIGNWVVNSTREDQRFEEFDQVEQIIFEKAVAEGMEELVDFEGNRACPSRAFVEGGIHQVIATYEDTMFYNILAEDLVHRDMDYEPINPINYLEYTAKIQEYLDEFEKNGTDNITIQWEE